MPPSIELRAKQTFALTPRLQQSVRLLQLSSLEFQQELRNALDTNPFLEYDPSAPDDPSAGKTADAAGADGDALPAAERDTALEGSAAESAAESAVPADDGGGDFSGDAYGRGA